MPCWPSTMWLEEPRRPEYNKRSAPPRRKSPLFARRSMRTRKAILPDAKHIHELISAYAGDGTLLPRTLAEICENVRDFVVLENEGQIIGCGALHLYGTHLAEIRSITVAPSQQGKGGAGGGEKASCHLHMPVHPCSGILRAHGFRNRTARGSAG